MARSLGCSAPPKRILIGIPSFEEADAISHVTSVIDQGLRQAFNSNDCLIVNVDSASTDGTAGIFLATPTTCAKHAVRVDRQPPGKGANVLAFFELCHHERVAAAALIDADVTSITPGWLANLLDPVLTGGAEMVFPLYRRSRFDGATTNLFAYPLLHATLRSDIRQPIAGEFGLSPDLIRRVLAAPVADHVLGYGIDISLSVQALASGGKTVQTSLGRKLHKPSHPKRDRIFTEVAASLLDALRALPTSHTPSVRPALQSPVCIDEEPPDSTPPPLSAGVETGRRHIEHVLAATDPGWLSGLEPELEQVAAGAALDDHLWRRILISWLQPGLAEPHSSSLAHARQLLPFYYLRMDSFWREIAHHAPKEVEMLITASAQNLRRELSGVNFS